MAKKKTLPAARQGSSKTGAGKALSTSSKTSKATKARSASKTSTPAKGEKRIRSITNAPQKVNKQEAIRERLRLHPLAMPNEIAAMLEFDGLQVTAREVEQIRGESGGAEAPMKRSPRSSGGPPRTKKR